MPKRVKKLHSLKNLEEKLDNLDPGVKYSLWKYGESYAGWLLIMDIATYISCMHYEETGETYLTFEAAMKEYDKIDLVTYLNIFLGMPALGYERSDAVRWLEKPRYDVIKRYQDNRTIHRPERREDIY